MSSTPPPPPLTRIDTAVALTLALALGAIYLGPSGLLPGNDATGSVFTAASLLAEGRLGLAPSRAPWLFNWADQRPDTPPLRLFDLTTPVEGVTAAQRYAHGELTPAAPYFLVRTVRTDPANGERLYVNSYGPGASVTALPVLAPIQAFAGDLRRNPDLLFASARIAAALWTSLAAVMVFLTARRWLARVLAAGLAALFALGTPAWSMASQALWQHPSDLFFLSLGALFITRAPLKARHAALAGLAFSAAAVCRPLSALGMVGVAGALLLSDRRAAAAFAAGALPLSVGVGIYNTWYLGSPFLFGQDASGAGMALIKTGSDATWPFRLTESVPGLLLSPSRGLLVFSPHLVLAAGGAVLAFRRTVFHPLRPLVAAAGLMLLADFGWYDWWGGWSYGWRRLTALAPALTLLLVPLVGWLRAARWRQGLLLILVGWAVLVQAVGALAYDVDGWNNRRAWRIAHPSGETVLVLDASAALSAVQLGSRVVQVLNLDVDKPAHRARLWSFSDNQIGYYLTNFNYSRRRRTEVAAAWVAAFRQPRGAD